MLFSKACLCVMLLYTFFIISKSTNEVICITYEPRVDDRHPPDGLPRWNGRVFWEKFPCKPICTRHILINSRDDDAEKNINIFKSKMTSMNQEKNEMGLFIIDSTYADWDWEVNSHWVKSHFNGIHIAWLSYSSYNLTKRLEFTKGITREMRRLNKTVSQSLLCVPPELIKVGQLSKDVDMTIVQIWGDPSKFNLRDVFTWCVLPLVNYGIPKNKIAVGKSVGRRFIDYCERNREMPSILTNFALRMTHFVKVQWGLAGVMVFGLESDDYTGQVCGMGKYPFLRAHVGDLLDSCENVNTFAAVSGAVVVNPTILMSLVYLIVLFEGFN